MDKPPRRGAPHSTSFDGEAYRARLARAKRDSTLQLLFRAARQLDEQALTRVAKLPDGRPLRRSHTNLFPHIDLEGTRVTELAQRVGISKQAVSQLLSDLEAAGVVERVVDPDDGRARRVRFTSRGRRGLLEGLAVLRAMERELSKQVGSETMAHLREALIAICAVLDETGSDEEA